MIGYRASDLWTALRSARSSEVNSENGWHAVSPPMKPAADSFPSQLLAASLAGVASGLIALWLTGHWPTSLGAVLGTTIAMLLLYRKARPR